MMICLTLVHGLLVYLAIGFLWLLFSWPLLTDELSKHEDVERPHVLFLCIAIYGFWLIMAWWWYIADVLMQTRRKNLPDD